jgi:hypothetical protein
MATKKNNYITAELDWSESQLFTWKAYIDKNPIHELKERVVWKEVRGGGRMPVVSETIGQQIKTLTDLMTKYLSLLEVVDKLREKEEAKLKEGRGGNEVPYRMQMKEKE